MINKNDISHWLTLIDNNDKFMIVICDTFNHSDYPVYCKDIKTLFKKLDNARSENMTKVMEVYDLNLSLEEQLNETRAYYVPQRQNIIH